MMERYIAGSRVNLSQERKKMILVKWQDTS